MGKKREPWKPGESGNPKGFPKEARARRRHLAELLDAALTYEKDDGSAGDRWVDAVREGVEKRDYKALKLAAQYRVGSPVQEVNLGNAGGMAFRITEVSDEDLAKRIAELEDSK